MKYKATCDFWGIITMKKGEVKELDEKNPNVINLVGHKLLEPQKEKKEAEKKKAEKKESKQGMLKKRASLFYVFDKGGTKWKKL